MIAQVVAGLAASGLGGSSCCWRRPGSEQPSAKYERHNVLLARIVRQARRAIYRTLNWNPCVGGFFHLGGVLKSDGEARRRSPQMPTLTNSHELRLHRFRSRRQEFPNKYQGPHGRLVTSRCRILQTEIEASLRQRTIDCRGVLGVDPTQLEPTCHDPIDRQFFELC